MLQLDILSKLPDLKFSIHPNILTENNLKRIVKKHLVSFYLHIKRKRTMEFVLHLKNNDTRQIYLGNNFIGLFFFSSHDLKVDWWSISRC